MPFWLQLFFLFGIPIICILTNAGWIIDHIWLTPKESKTIKRATRKKRPLVDVSFDTGVTEYKVVKEIGDEGYVKCEDGWIGFLPRAVTKGNPGHSANLTPFITHVDTLKHAKIPILRGYSGKAILTNTTALAMMEHARTKNEKVEMPLTINGQKIEAKVFWPVNLRTLKSLFPKCWNQAQVRASEVKSELVGMLKGKKHFGQEGMKYFVLPGMIIIAIIIGILAIMVLG
jgi:hypothetical protein